MRIRRSKQARDSRIRRRGSPPGVIEFLERRDLPAVTVSPISVTEGTLFSGQIATFPRSDITGNLADYTPTVVWGDGGTTTNLSIVPDKTIAGTYDVYASRTFSTPGSFFVAVTVKGSGTSSTAGAGQLTVAATPTIQGAVISGTQGSALTNVAVASFVDHGPAGTASEYTATIKWGTDLATTAGTVVAGATPGTYVVQGSFTYLAAGTFQPVVTVARASQNWQKTGNATALIAVSKLTGAGTLIQATVNQLFQGDVATFADALPGGSAASYTASIAWDGSTTTIPGVIVQTASGKYKVAGSNTFTTAGNHSATVTITRTSDSATAIITSPATVVPALTVQPIPVTATAGQTFSGPVLRFTGATDGPTTGFQATIDWGDGSTSPATVNSTATSGSFVVTGNHVYANPGGYTIKINAIQPATGASFSSSVPMTVFAFTGGLASSSTIGTTGGVTATNQQLPTLSGTAAPGSVVDLSVSRPGGGDPIGLGRTIANSAGEWSMSVGPLSGVYALYGVATPVGGDPTPSIQLNGGRLIAVEPNPARILGASSGPGANRVTLRYQRTAGGNDPAGLASTSSYTLILPNGRSIVPTSVKTTPSGRARRGQATVTLTFAAGSLPKQGDATLAVAFPGVEDATGSSPDRVLIPLHFGRRARAAVTGA